MIRNGLVTDVGPPFRPARHRVTDGGARRRPYRAVLMVDSFVPAHTTITWTVWPLGKPATAHGDPTGRASRMRPRPSWQGSLAFPRPHSRPGGLIRKCVPQETGIGTRTGCHVKWKPHAKSSPGFCNTKTGARCRQQPAYTNRQAAIWKHLRARQRPAKISDIGKPNVPKHSNPEHYGSGFTLDESLSISGTGVPRAFMQRRPASALSPAVCRSLIRRRKER